MTGPRPDVPRCAAHAALLAAVLAALPAAASDSPRQVHGETAARPLYFPAPRFPYRVDESVLPVEIEVRGRVNQEGVLIDPQFAPSEQAAFIDVLKTALRQWRFEPAVDAVACRPKEASFAFKVWFERVQGKPGVRVSLPPADGAMPTASPRSVVMPPTMDFPHDAQRAGVEGGAMLLMKVGIDGLVQSRALLYSTPHRTFGEQALQDFRDFRMAPLAEGDKPYAAICYQFPVRYCFTGDGDARFPFAGCAGSRAEGKK